MAYADLEPTYGKSLDVLVLKVLSQKAKDRGVSVRYISIEIGAHLELAADPDEMKLLRRRIGETLKGMKRARIVEVTRHIHPKFQNHYNLYQITPGAL